jgi:hypothetical protein
MDLDLYAQALKGELWWSSPSRPPKLMKLKLDGDGGKEPVDLPYCGIGDHAEPGVPITQRKRYNYYDLLRGIKKALKGVRAHYQVCIPKTITIPVYWNVITTNCSTASLIGPDVLRASVAQLNAAYNPHKIFFTEPSNNASYFQPTGYDFEGIRRFAQLTRGGNEAEGFNQEFIMRPIMRHGGKKVLHFFVIESITQNRDLPGAGSSTTGK